jgi:hypothetical protein
LRHGAARFAPAAVETADVWTVRPPIGDGTKVALLARKVHAFTAQGDSIMLPDTTDRVPLNTDDEINQWIRERTERSIQQCAAAGPEAIEQRLAELDREWDTERYLETMAPTFSLIGLTLGITKHRGWLLLPLVVQAFFLQHALQGWCPPLPVLRRLGIRTMDEINEERVALKALRGDFQSVKPMRSGDGRVTEALAAARS